MARKTVVFSARSLIRPKHNLNDKSFGMRKLRDELGRTALPALASEERY